jgi:hypothetical protein
VHRHRQGFNDPEALRYDAKQFFLKTPPRNGGDLQGLPGRARQHRADRERCNVKLRSGRTTCRLRRAAGFTLDDYFDHVTREGFAGGLPRLQQSAGARPPAHTIDEYERRSPTSSR